VVRTVVGLVLAAAGGIAGGSAIVTMVQLGDCAGSFEQCSAVVSVVPYLVGGIIAVVVSAFFTRFAMVIAPVAGLATAGIRLQQSGTDLLGDNLGFTLFIAGCVLAGPILVALISAGGAVKQRRAYAIAKTGAKAVAEVLDIRGTGVQINNQPQVRIRFGIHPLDGSPGFTYEQRRTIGFGDVVPRPGLRWPAWYTPNRKVAIAAPNGSPSDPQTRGLLLEFGIEPVQAYGFDPVAAGGPAGPSAPTFGTFGAAYQGFGD
jgi:hypothetical protein